MANQPPFFSKSVIIAIELSLFAGFVIGVVATIWAKSYIFDDTPYSNAAMTFAEQLAVKERAKQNACRYGPQEGGGVCPGWADVTPVAGSVTDGYIVAEFNGSYRTFTFPPRDHWPEQLTLLTHNGNLFAMRLEEEDSIVSQAFKLEDFGSCNWAGNTFKALEGSTFTVTPDGLFLGDNFIMYVSHMPLHPELDVLETELKASFLSLLGVRNISDISNGTWVYTWQQVTTGTFDILFSDKTPVEWINEQVQDDALLEAQGIVSPFAQQLTRKLWEDAQIHHSQGLPLWEAIHIAVNLRKQENLEELAKRLNEVETPYWLVHQELDDPYVLAPIGNTAPCDGTNWAETAVVIPRAQN